MSAGAPVESKRMFWSKVRITVRVLALMPLVTLIVLAVLGELGANPIEEITHETGQWALRFLAVSLAVTPARRILGWNWAAPYRRMFGLFAFFYASLHLATYVGLDKFFDVAEIGPDLIKRRFIFVGMAAYAILFALAVTSTRAMMRRLGRHWATLHKLAYLAAILGVMHFVWLVKADLTGPLAYAAVFLVLLGMRAFWAVRSYLKKRAPMA